MSFKTIQDFYADAIGLKVSTGFLTKQIHKASEALKRPYDDLVEQLKKEDHLHSDETGGKENGKRRWTWCLRAKDFTVFHMDPSRGSEVLEKILGKDFAGKISCDFFSAYRKFAKGSGVKLLFCWVHLIREVKYISESKDKKVARYGKRLLEAIGKMFKTIHRQDDLHCCTWFRKMQKHRALILEEAWHRLPRHDKDAWNEEEGTFRFIEEDLPATNNLCE